METLNITYSRISTHRTCPQRFNYQYIRGLQQDRTQEHPVELLFGNWWHAVRAVDSIVRGVKAGSLRYLPERLGTAEGPADNPHVWAIELPALEALVEDTQQGGTMLEDLPRKAWATLRRWENSLTDDQKDAWLERVGELPYDRLRYVNARWEEAHAKETATEQPLAVELPWTRALPSLAGVDPLAEVHGFVDEVYLDTVRNIVVVRDHKSNKSLENRSTVDEMMDSQLQMYAWGVSPWLTEQGLSSPKAVAYDRVRMTAPKAPKITLTGTLSKSVTDYDLHTYLEFCKGEDGNGVPFEGRKKDGSQAGIYTAESAVVENLQAPPAVAKWLIRQKTPLNRNIVVSHLRSAVDSSLDIRRTRERVEASQEAGRNLSSSCKWCPFAQLCRAEMVGGPGQDYDLESMGLVQGVKSGR